MKTNNTNITVNQGRPTLHGFASFTILTAALVMVGSGCASLGSETNRAIVAAKKVDLHEFRAVRIVPLSVGNSGAPETAGQLWAEKLETLLIKQKRFSEVTIGNPTGRTDELVISGTITDYVPGNAAVRTIAGGGTRAKALIKLASRNRPNIYSFPSENQSMGGVLMLGAAGAIAGAASDIDFVMESIAMVTDLVIKKAQH